LSKDGSRWKDVAFVQVQRGVKAFYKVYERWPASWKEVAESRIYQAPLYGPQFQVIDPDDKRADFYMDIVYQPGATPKVYTFAGSKHYISNVKAPEPYSGCLPRFAGYFPEFDSNYYLADQRRLKMLAIVFLLDLALADYYDAHGRVPETLEQLFSSGFSPINETSVNPLTGRRFRFDGSANDFRVERKGDQWYFLPVNGQGRAEQLRGIQ
jgi:hypothetical protein